MEREWRAKGKDKVPEYLILIVGRNKLFERMEGV